MPTTVADLPGDWSYLRKPPIALRATNGGYESTLTFQTDFANLSDFILAIAGTANTITTGWGSVSRVTALQPPLFPALLADEVEMEAFGTASTTSDALEDMWSDVKIRVNFRSVPFAQDG